MGPWKWGIYICRIRLMDQTSGWFFLTLFRYRNVWANFDPSHMLYVSCSHRFLHHSLQVFWATKHCKSLGLHPEPPGASLFGGVATEPGPEPSALRCAWFVCPIFGSLLLLASCSKTSCAAGPRGWDGSLFWVTMGYHIQTMRQSWQTHIHFKGTSTLDQMLGGVTGEVNLLGIWPSRMATYIRTGPPGRVDPRLCSHSGLSHSIPWCKPSFSPLNLP